MFERWTDRARRSVILAQEEARMLCHGYVGTEHLLLGLIHEGEAVAAQVLTSSGVTLEAAREQVERIIGQGQQAPAGHLPFTPRAKKVNELALREALQLGCPYIGTEHVLLGIVREGEGVASKVLVKLGVDLDDLRTAVLEKLHGYERAEGKQPKPDVSYARPATLDDVLRVVDDISSRLGAIERHLGIADAEPLRAEDLRVDVYRSGSETYAARVTHLPTGLVVTKESRTGLQAKAEALEELRSRVAAGVAETQTLSDETE